MFYKGEYNSKIVIYFEKQQMRSKEIWQKATVHVTLDQDLNVAKFDVDLDSIPGEFVDGFEIVPTFEALNFDNNKTFHSDSNGLGMQKRVLNERAYYNYTEQWYDFKHPAHNQNISGNYYPVNSAVSLLEAGSGR